MFYYHNCSIVSLLFNSIYLFIHNLFQFPELSKCIEMDFSYICYYVFSCFFYFFPLTSASSTSSYPYVFFYFFPSSPLYVFSPLSLTWFVTNQRCLHFVHGCGQEVHQVEFDFDFDLYFQRLGFSASSSSRSL